MKENRIKGRRRERNSKNEIKKEKIQTREGNKKVKRKKDEKFKGRMKIK